MSWAAIMRGLNVTVANHCGEPAVLASVRTGETATCDAVIVREPTIVDDTGAWEPVPFATVPTSQVQFTPSHGDILTDADGSAWIVDRSDTFEGMYRLTLRANQPRSIALDQ